MNSELEAIENAIKLYNEKALDVNNKIPYLISVSLEESKQYNHKFFDKNAKCKCGHPYYRHFDSYENNEPIGCKYCDCYDFELAEETDVI